jgi:tripartite-type tricarboxylate transporter receptor subunit TctC
MKRMAFASLLMAVGLTTGAVAQDYPSKPIKFVVPFAAGGGNDIVARIVAEKLSAKWPTGVIVENKPGAGGNLGAEVVLNSPPDGYTLLFSTQGPLVVNKSLYPKLSYDLDTLVPISYVASSANVLTVNPKVPANNLKELIAYAKANPDKLNYASQGVGTTAHLAAELLKEATNIKIVHVPYKGTGPALTDLIGGQVEVLFAELSAAGPLIRDGKLKAIAVGSQTRNRALPDVAPAADDIPGFLVMTWYGLVAPPGTPPAVITTMSQAVTDVLNQPDIAKRLDELGVSVTNGTPSALAALMKDERARWGKVIQNAGIAAN